ncbi:MAG: Flp pilus assembly complex ATPase component TadA, partial [Actinomycetia bacterium]|nr:Flp pilus assembly complex ATPase component TadA [Actinomycetes bacterium]
MVKLKKRIGKLLIESGLITEEQLQEAVESEDGKSLSKRLVDLGFITDEQIAKAIAEAVNLPYLDLAKKEIDPNATALISEEIASRYMLIPIEFEENNLVVAMSDPANIFAIDDLRIITGHEIKVVVTSENSIQSAINQFSKTEKEVQEMVESVAAGDEEEIEEQVEEKVEEGEEAPVVKLVNVIITEAFRSRAADIHIEPQEHDVRIRYRIDGVLHEVMRSPKKVQTGMLARVKIMANMDIAEKRVPQDGRFSLIVDGKPVDFRVASLPTVYGEKIVLRLLEKESIMIPLKDLGFSDEGLKKFMGSLKKPYGAIFITGPTGCGKTTTLYAALNEINTIQKNLLTVEDPVEYRLSSVNQIQVNPKAGLTFASSLRSILRHDPDIVMIGEVRDQETALIAIESALTGHLVLTTLHTNNAPLTITRLTEMGIEPFLTSSALDCVLAQRLARKLCEKCKEE